MTTLTGVMPVVPTAFADDEELDLASQRRVTDFLIDAEVDGICVVANYSEQFSLSDAERATVVETTLEHVAGRVPVCVATSHYSARIANDRNRAAEERGAAMVMMMPPFYGAGLSVDETALEAYFDVALEGVSIPLMLQDAPLSATRMSASAIAALARALPTLRYAKIEMPQTAAKLRALAATAGDDLPGLFDGEEAVTLIPDLEAGAVGTMTSALLPEHAGRAARAFLAGDREGATAIWEDVLPLIQYENRQCGLRASKEVLHAGGVLASARTRAPFGPIDEPTRRGLLELAHRKDLLALRWAAS